MSTGGEIAIAHLGVRVGEVLRETLPELAAIARLEYPFAVMPDGSLNQAFIDAMCETIAPVLVSILRAGLAAPLPPAAPTPGGMVN